MIKYLLLLLLLVPNVSFAALLESNEGSSIDMENFGTSASKGQSFEHSVDFDVSSIEFWGGLGDTPATEVNIEIYDGEAYGGSVLCSENNFDVSGLPNYASPAWNVLNITCPSLTANTRYTIKVTPVDGSSSDGIRWATSDTTYATGMEYYGASGRSGRDTMFRVNGTEAGGGGGGGTTTSSSTSMVVMNPSQDYFNAIILFYLTMFLMLYLFRRRR